MTPDPETHEPQTASWAPGVNGRGLRLLQASMVVVVAVFIAILAVLVAKVRLDVISFEERPADNIYWNVTQLELDLVQFKSEVDLAAADPDRSLDELRKRFDLFYSRVDSITNGSMFEHLGMSDLVVPLEQRLSSFLRQTTPVMDEDDAALRSELSRISASAGELHGDLRRISLNLIETYAMRSDDRRAKLAEFLREIAWATGGLVALLMLLLATVLILKRQAEQSAKATHRASSRLQATVETALDAVVVIGSDGRVIDYNRAAETIFGYTRGEAIGAALEDLIIPNDQLAAHRVGFAGWTRSGESQVVDAGRVQMTARCKDGLEFPVELSIASTDGPDGTIFIAYIRDISRRLAAELAVLSARDEALAAERAKTNFLAVMSHEMRTPLNGVMAALEIAAEEVTEEKPARFIDLARTSARQLLRHVADVLDISKIESGNLALAEDDFDLEALLSDLVDAQEAVARGRGNKMKFAALSHFPRLRGDSFRLGQVVQNLLSNAIKFTNDGSIALELELVGEDALSVTAEIRVSDTGIGISNVDLDRVFDDFVMLDPSYGREVGGTGLGLAISRRLIEAMGGKIGVESERGQGSCFWIRIPIARAAVTPEPQAKAAIPMDTRAAPQGGLDLLVVEDNQTNSAVLEEMLVRMGHRVTLAANGHDGVAQASLRRFDTILMDISMPVMDGITAARMIRTEGASRASRILAVTAHIHDEDIDRCRGAGMDGYLFKPISIPNLKRALAGGSAQPESLSVAAGWSDSLLVDRERLGELQAALGAEAAASAVLRFIRDSASRLDGLDRIIAEGETEALIRLSHEISGAAAMIGAARMRMAFEQAEHHCREGDLATAGTCAIFGRDILEQTATAFSSAA